MTMFNSCTTNNGGGFSTSHGFPAVSESAKLSQVSFHLTFLCVVRFYPFSLIATEASELFRAESFKRYLIKEDEEVVGIIFFY